MLDLFKAQYGYTIGKTLTIASFVDDTYLLVTSESYEQNINLLEKYFGTILDWAKNEGHVKFEPTKYELMHFRRPRSRKVGCKLLPEIGETVQLQEQSMRVLGVHIDPTLTWHAHITEVSGALLCCAKLNIISDMQEGSKVERWRALVSHDSNTWHASPIS